MQPHMPSLSTLRRAAEDAMQSSGMTVGLPVCKVDASQLQHMIAHLDQVTAQRDLLLEVVQAIAGDGIQRVSDDLHQLAVAALELASG